MKLPGLPTIGYYLNLLQWVINPSWGMKGANARAQKALPVHPNVSLHMCLIGQSAPIKYRLQCQTQGRWRLQPTITLYSHYSNLLHSSDAKRVQIARQEAQYALCTKHYAHFAYQLPATHLAGLYQSLWSSLHYSQSGLDQHLGYLQLVHTLWSKQRPRITEDFKARCPSIESLETGTPPQPAPSVSPYKPHHALRAHKTAHHLSQFLQSTRSMNFDYQTNAARIQEHIFCTLVGAATYWGKSELQRIGVHQRDLQTTFNERNAHASMRQGLLDMHQNRLQLEAFGGILELAQRDLAAHCEGGLSHFFTKINVPEGLVLLHKVGLPLHTPNAQHQFPIDLALLKERKLLARTLLYLGVPTDYVPVGRKKTVAALIGRFMPAEEFLPQMEPQLISHSERAQIQEAVARNLLAKKSHSRPQKDASSTSADSLNPDASIAALSPTPPQARKLRI